MIIVWVVVLLNKFYELIEMAKNTNYTSDAMNFIKEFLDKNPNIVKKQDCLRKTWWDHDTNSVNESKLLNEDNLTEDSYKYFNYKK